MTLVNQLGNTMQVFNALIPQEGPKTLPLSLDFSAADQYVLDYYYRQSLAALSMVQTLYIDMKDTDNPLTVTIPGSGQVIRVKGRTQGYYPVMQPNPIRMIFDCPGGPANLAVHLINVPVFASQWATK